MTESDTNPATVETVDFGDGSWLWMKRVSVCDCDHDSCWVRRGDPSHCDCSCPREDGWIELRLFDDDSGDWDTSHQILLKEEDMLQSIEKVMTLFRAVTSREGPLHD